MKKNVEKTVKGKKQEEEFNPSQLLSVLNDPERMQEFFRNLILIRMN